MVGIIKDIGLAVTIDAPVRGLISNLREFQVSMDTPKAKLDSR